MGRTREEDKRQGERGKCHGLETGIVGATAARLAWTAFVLPELVPRDACQRANCQRAAVRACRVRGGACRGAVHTMRACCQTSYGHLGVSLFLNVACVSMRCSPDLVMVAAEPEE